MNRKKKLRLTQFFLMTFAAIIIFFTYYNQDENIEKKILSKETQEKVKKQLGVSSEEGDVFYNIEYSGFDLNGNRYILQSEEALNDKIKNEIVKMKSVKANFYFKDDTVLFVTSDQGVYNNVTLDMTFTENVKATYIESKLFAQKAALAIATLKEKLSTICAPCHFNKTSQPVTTLWLQLGGY